MYKQNYKNSGGFRFRSGYSSSRYSGRSNFSGRPKFGRPKSQLINEVELFIKKAVASAPNETEVSTLFSDLPISGNLKNNIAKCGYR